MNKYFSSLIGRIALIFISAISVLLSTGCATGRVLSSTSTSANAQPVGQNKIVISDTIFALGRPDAAFAKQIGSDKVVAFLGKQNTYLLAQGGERLLNMSNELDSERIKLVSDSWYSFTDGKSVWGSLQLIYNVKGLQISASHQQKLNRLGFVQDIGVTDQYKASVEIKGVIYPAIDLSKTNFARLPHAPDLIFRAPSSNQSPPDFVKALKLPVAIAVDVITAPIQLLGFGFLYIVMRNAGP